MQSVRVNENFVIDYSDLTSSFVDKSISRYYNWIDIKNSTNQPIVISFRSNDSNTVTILERSTLLREKFKFGVLKIKYYDSAPTKGKVIIICDRK